jgi:hypothetical protein
MEGEGRREGEGNNKCREMTAVKIHSVYQKH